MARSKVTIKSPKGLELLKSALADLTTKVGNEIVEIATATAPVKTGNYQSQITYDGANTVTAHANYSAAIEYGTAERIIEAKNAKVLHFKKDGQDVFAKRVKHPATAPNPVMRNAAAQTQKEISQLWKEAQTENGL